MRWTGNGAQPCCVRSADRLEGCFPPQGMNRALGVPHFTARTPEEYEDLAVSVQVPGPKHA